MLRHNQQKISPKISNNVYIDPTAVIIGDVTIGNNVFVGPGAVIRADEPETSIIIKNNCNVQDRVIIHALTKSSVLVEENTSLAHGCIIHGPCTIGKNCFIGFGSVVFKAELGDRVCVKHLSVVEGVNIGCEKLVESRELINCEDKVQKLNSINEKDIKFMDDVVKANLKLTSNA